MDANIARAASAYQTNKKLTDGLPSLPSLNEAKGPSSFSDLLGDVLQNAIDTGVRSERIQEQALTGQVELADLVTAVAEAELTLNTVVSVRDRVIAAYQEIVRMPI